MANFPTHVTTSAVLGAAYGTSAHVAYGLPLPSCLLAGGLCTIAGVLPDVDSDNAVILREILAFVAAVIPMLLLDRFRELGWPQESIVVASGLIYVIIRFGIGEIIRRITIHRGMWHSIPAALLASLVIYLLCACPEIDNRLFKSGAVFVGYVWHLLLDEIYAVESGRGRVRVKRSFGTALKLWGPNPIANFGAYAQLAGLVAILFIYRPAHQHTYEQIAQPTTNQSARAPEFSPATTLPEGAQYLPPGWQPTEGPAQPRPPYPTQTPYSTQTTHSTQTPHSTQHTHPQPYPPQPYPQSQMTPVPGSFDPYAPHARHPNAGNPGW